MFLQWIPPPTDLQYGVIIGYIIDYLEDHSQMSISVAANVLQYTIEATPHTEYVLGVAALNSAGRGPLSPTVEVRTQEECTFTLESMCAYYIHFALQHQLILH